jgi:predicted porin
MQTFLRTSLAGASLLSIALLTAQAQAQSSVTVAGVADSAARSVNNSGLGSMKSLVSGSNSTSRLIIRGNEDLGGGLSASFFLEHGILLDTGTPAQATQFWDRRSTVSLASNSLGELRLGRDFIPSYLAWNRYDPFGYVGAAGTNNFVSGTPLGPIRNAFGSNPNTTVRANNAIQYWLPGGIGGVEGNFMVGAGEGGVVANGAAKLIGGRLGWAGGPVGFSAAYTSSENQQTTTGKFTDTSVGGTYNVGPVRINAAWRQYKQSTAKQTNLLLAGIFTTGQTELKLSYLQANMAGRVGTTAIDANDAKQIGLGAVYNLSKRSAVYAHYARISNKGAATFVVPGGPAGIAGGKTSTGYEVGVRHTF